MPADGAALPSCHTCPCASLHVRLDVEVHAEAVLAVHDRPAAVRVHPDRAHRVAQTLKLTDHGITGLAHLEADVVHSVAVLVEELPEGGGIAVSYRHIRAHETGRNLVCRLLLEKKKKQSK